MMRQRWAFVERGARPSARGGGLAGELPSVTGRQVLRALARDGWTVKRTTGHVFLSHPFKAGRVSVPNHPSATVKEGTLRSILTSAGLSIERFRELL
jgi:predicted RNA binding protein YcfA (HicA-like mRNA interferase family)